MSLPQSLGVSLKKFQNVAYTSVRITGDRASYGSADTITFDLPRTGVVDLASLAVLCSITLTGTGTIKTLPFHSGMIRKVSFLVGGAPVSLTQLGDYGFAFLLNSIYGGNKPHNDFLQTIGNEGNITLTSGTASDIVLCSSFLGMLSGQHCRFLPMDILPPCQIQIDLHSSTRWATATTITASSLTNMRLLLNRADFPDNLLSNLWADRISKAPVQIPFPNISYLEGATVASAGSATYTGYANSQSVDYIVLTNRPSAYSTVLTTDSYFATNGGDSTTLLQANWNGVPLSSWQLNIIDCLWQTQSALDGAGNSLFSPDFTADGAVSASGTDYRDKFFALFYRMKTPTDETDGRGWQTGVSTFGQSVPIDHVIANGSATSRKPVMLVYSTGVMEVGAGKQVIVSN
jgi:hypothetical protein